jgi:hypothetical protein
MYMYTIGKYFEHFVCTAAVSVNLQSEKDIERYMLTTVGSAKSIDFGRVMETTRHVVVTTDTTTSTA